VRAVELIRQGDGKLARGELDALGVTARTAPQEMTLGGALLLHRSGAVGWAHGYFRTGMNSTRPPRTILLEWLEHYPGGALAPALGGGLSAALREHGRDGGEAAVAARGLGLRDHARGVGLRSKRVVSPAKAFGLMQLISPTAKNMATPLVLPWDDESLKKPEVNVALGCRYLTVLRGQFSDSPLLAIPGYNAGGGAPKKWLDQRPTDDFDFWVERIPYEETRQYTKRVITSLTAYEFLYAREQASEARSTPLAVSPAARAAASP
jgi:soluble lytic murein transglycosylase